MSLRNGPPRRAARVGLLLAATAMLLSGSVSFAAHVNPSVTAVIPVGDSPWSVAANPATTRIYATNLGPPEPFPGNPDTVSVINGATNTVVATVGVGSAPLSVGVNPTTNRVYVTNNNSNTVSVINGATNAVVATIPFPAFSAPDAVAVNPVTQRAYVATSGAVPNTIRVIDGTIGSPTENTVIAVINLGVIDFPGQPGLAVNSDTNRIYAGTIFPLPHAVRVIDGATNAIIATIPLPLAGAFQAGPSGIGVNPTTDRIYVTMANSDSVAVINGTTNAIVTTIAVGDSPEKIGVNPNTNRIYVVNLGSGTVSVIDGGSNTVIATVPIASPTRGVVGVDTATDRVYVANSAVDTVSVLTHPIAPPVAPGTINDLIAAVQALPLDRFRSVGIGSGAFQAILFNIENKINDGRIAEAIESLLSLRQHVDGCGAEPDNNDWILDCADQEAIRNLIDAVIAGL